MAAKDSAQDTAGPQGVKSIPETRRKGECRGNSEGAQTEERCYFFSSCSIQAQTSDANWSRYTHSLTHSLNLSGTPLMVHNFDEFSSALL
jgi:hypothetical protein